MKKKNRFIILIFIFMCNLICYSQSELPYLCDTIIGDLNVNNKNDTIIVKCDNSDIGMFKVLLTIKLTNNKGDIIKTKTYEGLTYYPEYSINRGYVTCCTTSHRVMNIYYCSVYKFIKSEGDWSYYGGLLEDNQSEFEERVRNGWQYPFLGGQNLYKDSKSFALEDSTWIDIPNVKDSIIQIFNNDYDTYLSEYKSKKYDKTYLHNIYKTLDYLNYVEINKGTVQKYNDIGFFLIDADNCQQAIYILENVVSIFPHRIVAYLNLGDAYYGNGNSEEAIEMYKEYIKLMKSDGKENRIPKRILVRIAE